MSDLVRKIRNYTVIVGFSALGALTLACGGGSPTKPKPPQPRTEVRCLVDGASGSPTVGVFQYTNSSTGQQESPVTDGSGCATLNSPSGTIRLLAGGHWDRNVSLTGTDGGNAYTMVSSDPAFTARITPMLNNGVTRWQSALVPGEMPGSVVVQFIAPRASDRNAIETAVGNIPRLSANSYHATLQEVTSPSQFVRSAGYINLEPGNTNQNDTLYTDSRGFNAGSHITYHSGELHLDRILEHELGHTFFDFYNNHSTNGGIMDLAVTRYDSLDGQVIPTIYRMRNRASAAEYGIGGTASSPAAMTGASVFSNELDALFDDAETDATQRNGAVAPGRQQAPRELRREHKREYPRD